MVSGKRLVQRRLHKKGKLIREFYTWDIFVVRKHVELSRKYGVSQKLVFKTRVSYRVIEKDTSGSYWINCLPFCEGLGILGWKVKVLTARMYKIPSTIRVFYHVDKADTIFFKLQKTEVGHINQCHTCGQIYSLIVTSVITIKKSI